MANDLFETRKAEFEKKIKKIIAKKVKRAGKYHKNTKVMGPNNLRRLIMETFEEAYFVNPEMW